MPRVVVDQDIAPTERLRRQLPGDWDLEVGIEETEAGTIEGLTGADVALVTSRIKLTRAVFEATDLSVLGKIGTGIDNVDLEAAAEHDVVVTYTPGHNALSVAEHTLGLLLSTLRHLTESRRLLESGRWRDESTLGTQLSGKTVGIVGFGNVGRRVGRLLAGFDVELVVHDPYVASIDPEVVGGELTSFDRLLRESDAVTVNAELTEETRGMFDAGAFDRMQDSAVLVNTARGPIVDQAALVDALRSGAIAGAGLDVFETEPLGADAALLEFDNVVVSPHVAGTTNEARASTIDRLADSVRAIVEGRDVPDRYLATPG